MLEHKKKNERGRFARFRVQIDLDKLISSTHNSHWKERKHVQAVQYEGIHLCFFLWYYRTCNSECTNSKNSNLPPQEAEAMTQGEGQSTSNSQKTNNQIQSTQEMEDNCGPWNVVPPKKSSMGK